MKIKEEIKIIGVWIWALLAGAVLSLAGYYGYRFFNPRYEEVRRTTFEESKAYNHGMLRDLQDLRMKYIESDVQTRTQLRGIILHRFAAYPEDRMPNELRSFYRELKRGEL